MREHNREGWPSTRPAGAIKKTKAKPIPPAEKARTAVKEKAPRPKNAFNCFCADERGERPAYLALTSPGHRRVADSPHLHALLWYQPVETAPPGRLQCRNFKARHES